MLSRPIEILLVEDSPGDIWLTRETLLQGPVPKNIRIVTNGEQALDFVNRRGEFADEVRPDLVLLDLNLPRRDGLDVLREIKKSPDLRSITVIILTTSQAPVEVNAAYDLNVNCYVVKPVDLEEFTIAIRGIEHFWMSLASLPTLAPGGAAGVEKAQAAGGATVAEGNGSSAQTRIAVRKKIHARGVRDATRVARLVLRRVRLRR